MIAVEPAALKKEPPSKAVPLIRRAMESLSSEDEWFTLSSIGSQLIANNPDFDYRTYGSAKLGDLLDVTGQFEVDRSSLPARVRRKPQPNHDN